MRLGAAVRSRLREPGIAALSALAALPVAVVVALFGQQDHYRFGDEAVTVIGGRVLTAQFPEGLWDPDFTTRGFERLLAWMFALCLEITPSTADAFQLMHVLQALVAASAAIPVAILLRALGTPRWWCVAGGLLAVLGPWAVFGVTLLNTAPGMTVFAWVLVAALRVVRRPGPASDLLFLLAVLALAMTRSGNAPLAAGAAPAILWAAWERGGSVRGLMTELLRRHFLLVLAGVAGAGALAVKGVSGLFGSYGAGRSTYLPWDVLLPGLKTLGGHTAVATGVIALGFALPWIVRAIVAAREPQERAFGLAAIGAALVFAYVYAPALNEDRYFAVLTPLVVVPFVHALAVRPLSLRWALPGAALLAWLLKVGTNWGDSPDAYVVVPSSQWWNRVVEGRLTFLPGDAGTAAAILGGLVVVAAAVLATRGSGRMRVVAPAALLALVLVNQAAAAGYVTDKWIELRGRPDLSFEQLTFVDRAVGGDGSAMLLLANPTGDVNVNFGWDGITFWNRSVDVGSLDVTEQPPCCLGGHYPLHHDARSGILFTGLTSPNMVTPLAPDAALAGRTLLVERAVGYRVDALSEPRRLAFIAQDVTPRSRTLEVWTGGVEGDACLNGELDGTRVRIGGRRVAVRPAPGGRGEVALPARERVEVRLAYPEGRVPADVRLVGC